jgi:hypothetical protein
MAKPQVLPPKPDALQALFPTCKPVIGVIHLRPRPGAPRYGGEHAGQSDLDKSDFVDREFVGGVAHVCLLRCC